MPLPTTKRGSMARGENPTLIREKPNPPEWGTLTKDQLKDAMLMQHTSGKRVYIPNGEVDKKKKRGWSVVGGEVKPESEVAPMTPKKKGLRQK